MPENKRGIKSDLARLDAMRDEDIVYDEDSPDMGDDAEYWFNAVRNWNPVRDGFPAKQSVTLRIDEDILDWFKQDGPRYQTRMNWALRVYMDRIQRMRTKATPAKPRRRAASPRR